MNKVLITKIVLGILGGVLGIFVAYLISYGLWFVVPSSFNGPIAMLDIIISVPLFA